MPSVDLPPSSPIAVSSDCSTQSYSIEQKVPLIELRILNVSKC